MSIGDLSGRRRLEYDESSEESPEPPRKPMKKSCFSLSKSSIIGDEMFTDDDEHQELEPYKRPCLNDVTKQSVSTPAQQSSKLSQAAQKPIGPFKCKVHVSTGSNDPHCQKLGFIQTPKTSTASNSKVETKVDAQISSSS